MTTNSTHRVLAHANMTADEIAAWESMARDGSLAQYLDGFPDHGQRYETHLQLRIRNLRKAGAL